MQLLQNLPHRAVVRGTGSWALKCFANCLVLCKHVITVINCVDNNNDERSASVWESHCLCLVLVPGNGLLPSFICLPTERDFLEGMTLPLSLSRQRPEKSNLEEPGTLGSSTCLYLMCCVILVICPFWAQKPQKSLYVKLAATTPP